MHEKKITTFQKYWTILKDAGSGFGSDNAVKLSGSLAYSTIFSLPPMLLLIIISGGSLFGQDAIQGTLFTEINDVVGPETALQIQNMIVNLQFQQGSTLATIISIVALVIGATGIFVEIQSSLNIIWGVQSKPKKSIIKLVLNRLISFSMILGLGFLLIVTLLINTLVLALSRQIMRILPELPINLLNLTSTVISFLVLSFLFSIIFKMLPDVKIKWKEVLPGALVTTLLFLLGKFAIGLYINNSNTVSIYGAASSVIVLLMWIYYSAFILYFGAEFTRAHIEYGGKIIQPNSYAEFDAKQRWEIYTETQQKSDGPSDESV